LISHIVAVMARYQKKLPPPDIKAARSWVGKYIRDAYANQLGIVIGVEESKAGIRLAARFPEEKESRLIALDPQEDQEFISPGSVKARYRPPSRDDRERLEKLGIWRD
jgi:hypothetical protein